MGAVGLHFGKSGPLRICSWGHHMSVWLWMQHLWTHVRALAHLTSPSQGKAWHGMAWHGMVCEGMQLIYHLCHIADPIYPQKGATCPRVSSRLLMVVLYHTFVLRVLDGSSISYLCPLGP